MKAGFIGLGNLGRAMAGRLMAEGVRLVVWNRTRQKALATGAVVAESPSDVLSQAGVVFICLSDSAAVEGVLTGSGGLLECEERQGKVVVDTTTNHFGAAAHFHTMLGNAGVHYLEAPVLGSVGPARAGDLTVLASGTEEAYMAARPYLEKIGKTIYFLGAPGLALKMKVINNLVLGVFMAALAEAVAFGLDVGLERAEVLDILASGAGNSALLAGKREKLLNDDYTAHFSAGHLYKDLHYMQELARDLRTPLFTGSLSKDLFAMASARGLADEDICAIFKAIREFHI